MSAREASNVNEDDLSSWAKEAEKHITTLKYGANWFNYVGVLALVYLVCVFNGLESKWLNFIQLGLYTLVEAEAMTTEMWLIFAMAAALFLVFANFARRKFRQAFVLGILLYALDAVLCLKSGNFAALALHVLALLGLMGGYLGLKQVLSMETQLAESGQLDPHR